MTFAQNIRVQPDEGIRLKFQAKTPDEGNASKTVDMDYAYTKGFPDTPLPEAYERLLCNAIEGDASLFARSDGIAAAWRIIDPVMEGWLDSKRSPKMATYPTGSMGPTESDVLLGRAGHAWQSLQINTGEKS